MEPTTLDRQAQAHEQEQQCPKCGMPKSQWRGNNGQGFPLGDQTYCCQGCAVGTGCTCK